MTITSMTGFARAAGENADWAWAWELKTVNAKGLDIRLRAPSSLDALEPAARNKISQSLTRGNVSANLTLKRNAAAASYHVNESHLAAVIEAARRLSKDIPELRPPSVDGLLSVRGVIEASDEEVDAKARQALERDLLASLDTAIVELVSARAEEGARLVDVLSGFLDVLRKLHGDAAAAAETQAPALRQKLMDQVSQIMDDATTLDPGRIEQEVAILVTKADVREELDRLDAHIDAASALLKDGGAVGRRVDFLCQELNREANTICSKAHEQALTSIGLELKAVIEQFREQVQNIE